MNNPISLIDIFIILLSIVTVLAIGLYFRNKDSNTDEYFLAGRSLGWFAVGISLFATNISSEHFIGLAGSGASRGLAVGQFELIAIFLLILLGWFIAPIYKSLGVNTTPEFLEKRFDVSSRKFFSGISIFTYIITKILVTLFAGGILFNMILGWSIFTSAVAIVLLTGVYSLVGGFSAVVKTQVFQGILLITSTIVLTIYGLIEIGGISGLQQRLPESYFQMFKAIDDPDFPWTGIIFGAPIIAFWYWCADHYIVQRVLGAKNIDAARKGTLLAAALKILPLFVLVMPGLITVALYPEAAGDIAYPTLLASGIIPVGIKGFVIAGFLAAMMSSLSASFNSIAALYTLDFYKPKHPDASERTLVLVGRLVTIAIVVAVLLVIPFVKIINSHIYIFLQSTQAFISAPITAVFILGLIIKKINSRSAFFALVVGEFFGLSRFILELLVKENLITNSFLVSYAQINYLHFTIILFLATGIFLLVINYVFISLNKFDYGRIISAGDIYFNKNSTANISNNIIFAGVILIITLSIWYIFI
jgi:SSS family solute:Na+ symporter